MKKNTVVTLLLSSDYDVSLKNSLLSKKSIYSHNHILWPKHKNLQLHQG